MPILTRNWLICLACGALVCTALYAFLLSRGQKKNAVITALLTLLLGSVLGVICSRLLYCVTQIQTVISQGWLRSLLDTGLETWSFFGSAAGVLLGSVLAAKITRCPLAEALEAFAAPAALMIALARFAEYFLGEEWMIGLGAYVEEECWFFFPATVANEWGDHYVAVFFIEGVFALIAFAASLTVYRKDRFVRTLFLLCLPQIFCESMLTVSLTWTEIFVHIEQLLCMLVMEGLLIRYGRMLPKGTKHRFLSAWVGLGCAGIFILGEFSLEGKLPLKLPHWGTYAVVWVFLLVLLAAECIAWRRANSPKTIDTPQTL